MILEEVYKRYAFLEEKKRDIEQEQSELKERLKEAKEQSRPKGFAPWF